MTEESKIKLTCTYAYLNLKTTAIGGRSSNSLVRRFQVWRNARRRNNNGCIADASKRFHNVKRNYFCRERLALRLPVNCELELISGNERGRTKREMNERVMETDIQQDGIPILELWLPAICCRRFALSQLPLKQLLIVASLLASSCVARIDNSRCSLTLRSCRSMRSGFFVNTSENKSTDPVNRGPHS